MRRDTRDGPRPPTIAQTVVGTGLLTLDVIIPDRTTVAPRVQAGGTCGNLLTALAFLGWTAYPVARLGQDGLARRIGRDLAGWGVKLDFVLRDAEAETPAIAQHIRGATHSFSWRCPTCGADLPRYRSLRLSDIETVLPRLPTADTFFFDRVSPAAIRLAEHYGGQGGLVVFEPSGVGDRRLFRDALAIAHVVKFSRHRISNPEWLSDLDSPRLLIETRGDEGLRFQARLPGIKSRRWKEMPAIPVAEVRDTAGCGDWCSAGLLHALPAGGFKALLEVDDDHLTDAVRYGQALAAWNCGFEGARGGMYEVTSDEFHASVGALLAGRSVRGPESKTHPPGKLATQRFSCPACPTP